MAKKTKTQAALELLVGIKGVGTVTAQRLLDEFKTIEKVSHATEAQLLAAGLNARIADAVLKWSATQDKDRRPPDVVPAPAVAPLEPEPAATPATPAKPKTAADLPLPIPFGNPRDVHVRVTPPPELVDLESLRDGGPVRTSPLPKSGTRPAAAPRPAARPVTRPTPKKPTANVQGASTKPQPVPGLRGPYALTNGGSGWVFADMSNAKPTPRGKLIAFCDSTRKVLAYGAIRYGQAHVLEVK